MDKPGPALGVGLLLLVVGAAIAAGGGYLYRDATRAKTNAVEVDATVVATDVVRTTNDGGNAGQSEYVYAPDITYRYTYEGERHISSNVCPGEGAGCEPTQRKSDRSEVEAFLADYPEDGTVTAYVSPDEVSEAFLVRSTSSSTEGYLVLLGLGGVVLLLGLVMVVASARQLLDG